MRSGQRISAARIVSVVVIIAVCVGAVAFLGAQKKFQLQQYLQLALDGLSGGAIYALIALGFVVIHSVTGIINFAQGEFVMLGAMLSVTFYNLNLPAPPVMKLVIAIILAVAVTTVIGVVVERLAIFPARRSPVVALIIITIGATIVIRATALLVWSTRPYSLPAFSTLELEDLTLRWGGIILKVQNLWIWGAGAIILIALFLFFERTLMGKALRACAINRRAAQLMGISPSRMSLLSFGLAAAIGAVGGAVLAPATRPTYDMGLILGLKGFVAAIMGGLVSSPGAVLGGLVLGVVENIGAGVTSAGSKDIIAFAILILLLLFRPQGLWGGVEKGIEEG
jgi:branched-chain amino acid transport system permease protein